MTLQFSKYNISAMNRVENSLNKIAENIRLLDEASLTSLWDNYKNKVKQISNTAEWERSVIIFSIINAVRAKNAVFNEILLKKNSSQKIKPSPDKPKEKPYLKLVK